MRERWGVFTPETQVYLDWLMNRYGEELASGIAVRLAREIEDQLRNRQAPEHTQNFEACQEKLIEPGRRIQKLERQVETQRERLGQYYQASFRATRLERELERYHEVLDLSDRVKLQVELLALGTALGYRRLLVVPISLEPGQEAWCSYVVSSPNETLAKAIVAARHFHKHLKELGLLS